MPINESAREIAQRWFHEVWNERNADTIRELLAPDAKGHLEGNQEITGSKHFVDFHQALLRALPDTHIEILNTIVEADQACVLWRLTATHTGEAFGFRPTGNTIAVRGTTWFRIAGGKIIEGWDSWNYEGLFTQLAGRPMFSLG